MPVAALAALIPAAIQGITAISQASRARKMESEYDRPNMQIPQGMLDAVDMQKNLALQTGLPRQDLIEGKIDQSVADALGGVKESATSPWQITSAAQTLAGKKSDKLVDLGIAGANYNSQQVGNLTGLLEGLSKYQENQFMYNDFAPYMNAMNTIRGLREAGNQNLFSGAGNAAGVYAENPDMFNGIFGDGAGKSKARLEGMFGNIESSMAYNAPSA